MREGMKIHMISECEANDRMHRRTEVQLLSLVLIQWALCAVYFYLEVIRK